MIWAYLDWVAHTLHLPRRVQGWLCDRYDLSLGVSADELHRTAPVEDDGSEGSDA